VSVNDGSVREHTLDNLNEDSMYTMSVTAINTEGSRMTSATANTLTAGKCEVKYQWITSQVQSSSDIYHCDSDSEYVFSMWELKVITHEQF
jgi:hypothetical protein